MKAKEIYHNIQNITSLHSKGEFIALTAAFPHINLSGDSDSAAFLIDRASGNIIKKIRGSDSSYSSASMDREGKFAVFLEKKKSASYLLVLNTQTLTEERIELPSKPGKLVVSGDIYIILEVLKKKDEESEGKDGVYFDENIKKSKVFRYRFSEGFSPVTGDLHVWDFDVNEDTIVTIASTHPGEDNWFKSKIFLSTDGKDHLIYDPSPRLAAKPVISQDRTRVAFLESYWSDRGVTAGDVKVLSLKSGTVQNLTKDHLRSYGDVRWLDDGRIISAFNQCGRHGLSLIHNGFSEIWRGDGNFQPSFSPAIAINGSMIYASYTDANNPPEVISVFENGDSSTITGINKKINFRAVQYQYVEWYSTDNKKISGIVRTKNKKNPLVVYLHGGPTSSSVLNFLDIPAILASEGFTVFMPNFRGSTGMGSKFVEANLGDMGGMDVEDILSGIDYIRGEGIADTTKIMVTGGSYGGFLTNILLCRRRFSAAVSLFGISDWRSFHDTTQVPVWDLEYFRAKSGDWKKHEKFSPINFVERIDTPLLMMHGEIDREVPFSQSLQLFRELKDLGKNVRLLLFPREGHGFRERGHQDQYIEEMLKWFRKYSS